MAKFVQDPNKKNVYTFKCSGGVDNSRNENKRRSTSVFSKDSKERRISSSNSNLNLKSTIKLGPTICSMKPLQPGSLGPKIGSMKQI